MKVLVLEDKHYDAIVEMIGVAIEAMKAGDRFKVEPVYSEAKEKFEKPVQQ